MYLLFEEDGSFKTGSILAEQEASLQVESATGKRSKIKSANVLLKFAAPSAAQLLPLAEPMATGIEPDFLWECCSDGEFTFVDIARDYFGHEPTALEATATLVALQAAPLYFHRKGKGRFRKAPPDILAAALAGAEKKRQQALAIERMTAQLVAGELPAEFSAAGLVDELLYRIDRNKPEAKALEAAVKDAGQSAAALLMRCGALRHAYDFHFRGFLNEHFPKGTGFPDLPAPNFPADLPLAEAVAFSIDDAQTTEIDDAFSLVALPGIGWRVGIHIAAPGLAFAPQSEFDSVARRRLSTVYMPGQKITMLPDGLVQQFTLAAGQTCPAVSLYLTVSPELDITAHESRIERVRIAANLRHHEVEPLFNAETIASGLGQFAFRDELLVLWQLANACEGRRGKPSATQGINDYNFDIDGDLADPLACSVRISERKRGSPLDKLVAELMIVANATWGGLMAERKVACIYRAQVGGRVRMPTSPLPHEGLGVPQYAWCTSPLRRYTDMVNQWQLVALLRGETPSFGIKSELLFAAMRDFDMTYSAYADFQRNMERYWCLRWLVQNNVTETTARTLRREGMIKVDHLPLALTCPSLPAGLPAGTHIRVSVGDRDDLALTVSIRFVETLGDAAAVEEIEEDFDESISDEGGRPPSPADGSAVAGEVVEGAPT